MSIVQDVTETLREFVSININSAVLASQLMTIKPRKYSIASSPGPAPAQDEDTSTSTHGVSLVVGVLEYTTGKQNIIFFKQSKSMQVNIQFM